MKGVRGGREEFLQLPTTTTHKPSNAPKHDIRTKNQPERLNH